MRAVVTEAAGASPMLRDVPEPEPGPGELLVRVRASSLNAIDLMIAHGGALGMIEHRFPVILGRDFAGTVEARGEGAERFAVGDDVFGVVSKSVLADGGLAELLTVPEAMGVARIPKGMDLVQAGALGLAGVTALASVAAIEQQADANGLKGRETVLVSGATGGAGSFAVQLAAQQGLRVIATARPGEAAEFVLGLGASDVVDYTAGLEMQVRALLPGGVGAVLQFAGEERVLADLLAPGGRLVSTLGLEPHEFAGRDLTVIGVTAEPSEVALTRLATAVVSGRLRVPVSRTYTLDKAPQAFGDFAGTLGKAAVVLVLGDDL
jgi:NADPH:quinone reductase-like Zn-dependent oxidoreductase